MDYISVISGFIFHITEVSETATPKVHVHICHKLHMVNLFGMGPMTFSAQFISSIKNGRILDFA